MQAKIPSRCKLKYRFSDGRKFAQSRNFKTEKTMVGFGRTELSLSLSCTEFRALSHGHGFRGPCFQGVRKSLFFHDFKTVFLTFFLTFVFDICLNRFPTVSQLFSWVILDCQNKKYCEILAPWNFLVAATEKNKKNEWLANPYVFLLP